MPVRPVIRSIKQKLSSYWDRSSATIHVFWVCRASTASALIGFALLWLAPQAQDVFLDHENPWLKEDLWTAVFFAMIALVWAAPIHYSARLLLQHHDWAVGPEFNLLTLAAQRNRLNQLEARYGWAARWVPRILGVTPFFAVFGALLGAARDLPTTLPPEHYALLREHLVRLTAWTVISGALFFLYMYYRQPITGFILRRPASAHREPRPLLPYLELAVNRRELARPTVMNARAQISKLDTRQHELNHDRNFGLLFLAVPTVFFFAAFFAPVDMAAITPRAPFLAIAFGAWIPLLTLLAWLSHRWRTPVFVLAVIASSLAIALWGDNHDIRLADSPVAAEVDLADLVDQWKANNAEEDCSPSCRPIIIAAAGGASRAGYFTAAVIGELIDRSCRAARREDPDAGCGLDSPFARRLFAISSVSGSSVGAATLMAALVDAANGAPPCRGHGLATPLPSRDLATWRGCAEALMAGDYLTPTVAGLAFRDWFSLRGLWRDRGALLEEAWDRHYRDVLNSADDHPDSSQARGPGLERPFSSVAPTGREGDPWRPVLVLNGASLETGRFILTTPLAPTYTPLKVSDEEGTDRAAEPAYSKSPVLPAGGPESGDDAGLRIFVNSHHLTELLADTRATPTTRESIVSAVLGLAYPERCNDPDPGARRVSDVPLSTAAHNSARFPLISPVGSIRNACGQIVDRIGDGGYLEVAGVISALQLGKALESLGLYPIVLVISNDPALDDPTATNARDRLCGPGAPRDGTGSGARDGPWCPDAADGQLLSWLASPLMGLVHTRSARAELGIADLRTASAAWSDDYNNARAAEERATSEPSAENVEGTEQSAERTPPGASEATAVKEPGDGATPPDEAEGSAATSPAAAAPEPPEDTGKDENRQRRDKAVSAFFQIRVYPELDNRAGTGNDVAYKNVSMSWWMSSAVQAYLDCQITEMHNEGQIDSLLAAIGIRFEPAQPECG